MHNTRPRPRHRKPAQIVSDHLTGWERFWWVTSNIFTLGAPYFSKFVIKRAVAEAIILTDLAARGVDR